MKYKILVFTLLMLLFPPLAYARDMVNISVTRPMNAPYFIGMPEVNIDADEFRNLNLKIKSNRSGTARLFWNTSFDNQINERKSLLFYVDKSTGFKGYVFDLSSQSPFWAGFVGQIIIFPENGMDGFEVGSAIASHRDFISFLRSGWREFWAPGSRMIIGSSINNMKTITLWGKPFNYYLYAIIVMVCIASFFFYYYKSNDPHISWQNCAKVTILTSIAMWAVWLASFLVTEYSWLRADLNKYGLFTSLEYKQRASVGENFYGFLQFCKKELPEKADVIMITSDTTNFFNTKAGYYLFPIKLDAKEPQYLLVYMYNKNSGAVLSENPGFRFYKKYDEGAYILWKRKT